MCSTGIYALDIIRSVEILMVHHYFVQMSCLIKIKVPVTCDRAVCFVCEPVILIGFGRLPI